MEELSREKLIGILRTMWHIRYFEQKADDLFVQGKIHGTMHLSIGQEGVAAGAGAALEPDDYLLNTHRGHGHCIAKGADLNLMMAEFRGKEVGYCRGRGGSMHIADVARNNLGANGIVGGGIGLAMGVGLLIAPPIADRFGKIQVVVVTQALSIPFLFLMGFSPYYVLSAGAYYIRLALMNMSGPVYQTFVMERVEPSARATVASLVSMANNVGWAFSPQVSGWMQVNYGFDPAFATTITLYIIAIYMYWRYFWYADRRKKMQPFTPESI